jgi:hypothetical protein
MSMSILTLTLPPAAADGADMAPGARRRNAPRR